MTIIDTNPVFFPYMVRGTVCISEDYDTGRIDVKAHIGTAPDGHTVIVYPYRAYETGYMNKGNARKLASQMRRDMKEWAKSKGIAFTESVQMAEYFRR